MNRGGKREGAGRKPLSTTEKKRKICVTLSAIALEILKLPCKGNRSAAIEFVAKFWREHKQKE